MTVAQTKREREQTSNNVHMEYIRTELGLIRDYLQDVPKKPEIEAMIEIAVMSHVLKCADKKKNRPSIPPYAITWWGTLTDKQRNTIIGAISTTVGVVTTILTMKYGI